MRALPKLSLVLACLALSISAIADPEATLKRLKDVRTKGFASASKVSNSEAANKIFTSVEANVKAMAIKELEGFDAKKVDGKNAFVWAQIAGMAQKHRTVCDLVTTYISTSPKAADAFAARLLAMNSLYTLEDAYGLAQQISEARPTNADQYSELHMNTVYGFTEILDKKLGPEVALKALDDVAANPILWEPEEFVKHKFAEWRGYYPAGKPGYKTDAELRKSMIEMCRKQNEGIKPTILTRRSELLVAHGMRSEAIEMLDRELKSGALSATARKEFARARAQASLPGAKAPDFLVSAWGGSKVSLGALKGKVVVLDFWATWCGPCMEALPHMQKIHQATKAQGVHVLALNVWDVKTDYEKWVPANRKKYTFQFAFDPAGRGKDSIATAKYGVSGIPTTVVIDRDGQVVASIVGYMGESDHRLEDELAKLGVSISKGK